MMLSAERGVDRWVVRLDPEKDRITLRHLLTMSSGLAWDETSAYGSPSNTYSQMAAAPRADYFVLGNGGQRVFILPSLGAVVVTTAGLYGDKASGLTALTTLNEFVFPAAVEH